MQPTPVSVSPAQRANPALFQPTKLAAALKHILALEIIGTDAIQAADDALASFEKAIGPDRFTLLDPTGASTLNELEAIAAHDALTGITWLLDSSAENFRNDGPAEAYCKDLSTLGRSDWRLPTEPELKSIVDLDNEEKAICAPFIKGAKARYHWSSSPFPGVEDFARVVCFYGGYSSGGHRSFVFPVLACAGGFAGSAGVASPGQ
jgi:hypothetical protein